MFDRVEFLNHFYLAYPEFALVDRLLVDRWLDVALIQINCIFEKCNSCNNARLDFFKNTYEYALGLLVAHLLTSKYTISPDGTATWNGSTNRIPVSQSGGGLSITFPDLKKESTKNLYKDYDLQSTPYGYEYLVAEEKCKLVGNASVFKG